MTVSAVTPAAPMTRHWLAAAGHHTTVTSRRPVAPHNDELQHLVLGKLKVATFTYRHLQGNPDQQRFTMRSGVLTDNDTGGAAQVAAVHCPNERTLDHAVCSQTDLTIPQPAALWPSSRNVPGNDSLCLVATSRPITRY